MSYVFSTEFIFCVCFEGIRGLFRATCDAGKVVKVVSIVGNDVIGAIKPKPLYLACAYDGMLIMEIIGYSVLLSLAQTAEDRIFNNALPCTLYVDSFSEENLETGETKENFAVYRIGDYL
jgi:hypothetical protein